jgi:hypothetical protein
MKKKTTPLMLNKKSISSLKNTLILGGKTNRYLYFTSKEYCKTKCCSTQFYQDCTVTYEACVTELRFCGAF